MRPHFIPLGIKTGARSGKVGTAEPRGRGRRDQIRGSRAPHSADAFRDIKLRLVRGPACGPESSSCVQWRLNNYSRETKKKKKKRWSSFAPPWGPLRTPASHPSPNNKAEQWGVGPACRSPRLAPSREQITGTAPNCSLASRLLTLSPLYPVKSITSKSIPQRPVKPAKPLPPLSCPCPSGFHSLE